MTKNKYHGKLSMTSALLAVGFVVAFGSVVSAQSQADIILIGEAERRIGAHVKYIEKRTGEMVAAYYYTGAQRSLEQEFRKAGVGRSMMYAEPWGKNGIGLFWSENVKRFYEYHHAALNASLKNIRAKGSATKSELEYLDNGMENWKQADELFVKQFGVLIDQYTKSALINDRKEANESNYGARMKQIADAKPFRSDLYDAIKNEWARANKELDQENFLRETAVRVVKNEMAAKAAEHVFNAIDGKACPDAAERLRPDIKQTKKWILAETITFTKGSAVYLESDKQVLKTISTAGEMIAYIANVTKSPAVPPIIKIPMKYFKEITKAGNEIVQAGGRLTEQEKKKLVDLVVKLELVEVTVECVAVDVCKDGTWVRKGMQPNGEPTRRRLAPLIKSEQSVLAGEFWQRLDKYTRPYVAMEERFAADPCGNKDAAAPAPKNNADEDCIKLLAEIDRLREQISSIKTRDIPHAREELDRARTSLADWNNGLAEHKQALSEAALTAERELKRKQEVLRTARGKKANIESNTSIPNWRERMAAAEAAVAAALTDVQAAEKKLADAKARRAQADIETRNREGIIKDREQKIDELLKAETSIEARIKELRAEYENCRKQGK